MIPESLALGPPVAIGAPVGTLARARAVVTRRAAPRRAGRRGRLRQVLLPLLGVRGPMPKKLTLVI
jgi:hypothetical protein